MALKIVRRCLSAGDRIDHRCSLLGTLTRFCQNDGTWATSVSSDDQCKSCVGDGRPVKVRLDFAPRAVFALVSL